MPAERYVFPPPKTNALRILGSDAFFPVHRIFCVGRNYADHAKEMGMEVDREAPFYFTKPVSAITQSGGTIPYPPGTQNFHYEMELVLAIGKPAFRISEQQAQQCLFGYAGGLDLTRRDLQVVAREKGRPWDLSKAFENSAVVGTVTPVSRCGILTESTISLEVNGTRRQRANISDMMWSPKELIADLSHYYHLQPGDIIYTGTPAGVGPLQSSDQLLGKIDGLEDVVLQIGPAE